MCKRFLVPTAAAGLSMDPSAVPVRDFKPRSRPSPLFKKSANWQRNSVHKGTKVFVLSFLPLMWRSGLMKNPNLDNHKPRESHGCTVGTFVELHVFVGGFGSVWCLLVSGEVEVDSRGRHCRNLRTR